MNFDTSLDQAELPEISEKSFHPVFRPTIRALLEDLNAGGFHDEWTGVDLQRALDPAIVVAQPRGRRTTQLLAMVPTLLVFAPIAWTWYCLWQASDAYSLYLRAYPDTTTTFFTLWQRGFDGYLAPEFAFGPYAQYAIVFIALVVMSYFIGMVVQRREADAHDRAMRTWQAQLIQIERSFSVIRIENPRRLEESLSKSSAVLQDLFTEGRRLVEEVRMQLSVIEENAAVVRQASGALQDVLIDIQEAQRAQNASLAGVEQSLSGLHESVKAVPTALEKGLAANLSQLSSVVRQILEGFTANFEKTMEPVGAAMGHSGRFLSDYAQTTDALTQQLAGFLKGYKDLQSSIEWAVMNAQRNAGDAAIKFLTDVPPTVVKPASEPPVSEDGGIS